MHANLVPARVDRMSVSETGLPKPDSSQEFLKAMWSLFWGPQ